MKLEILTPDESVFSGDIDSIVCPGLDGHFGILNSHAPLIASLIKGSLKVTPSSAELHFDASEGKMKHSLSDDKKSMVYQINGGTVEVKNNKVIVLVE